MEKGATGHHAAQVQGTRRGVCGSRGQEERAQLWQAVLRLPTDQGRQLRLLPVDAPAQTDGQARGRLQQEGVEAGDGGGGGSLAACDDALKGEPGRPAVGEPVGAHGGVHDRGVR